MPGRLAGGDAAAGFRCGAVDTMIDAAAPLFLPLFVQLPLRWSVDLTDTKEVSRAGLLRNSATFVNNSRVGGVAAVDSLHDDLLQL